MANEKVTITISTLNDQELTVGTQAQRNEAPRQVDLFVATVAPTSPPAPETPQTPPEGEKTPPEAATPAAEVKKPWELSTERGKGLNFQPDELLHAKMVWVCSNVPGGISRLQILRAGAMAECDRLIAVHYKEQHQR